MVDPKIYLAADNCFLSKRYCRPIEWMEAFKALGIFYVEASADNECDPLYMGDAYISDWIADVKDASKKTGVSVRNLYSGHGTYATLGMTHYDARIRDRFTKDWVLRLVRMASALGAGTGFFCHAINDSILQNPEEYKTFIKDLYDNLAIVAKESAEKGGVISGIEQMYSPHQPPYTVEGSYELMSTVYKKEGNPFYITIDTGHQSGQQKFVRPTDEKILNFIENPDAFCWMGPDKNLEIVSRARKGEISKESALCEITANMDAYPHMFCLSSDGDTYEWLSKLGCYSPIVHLQQTDGSGSAHLSFTEKNNRTGLITGEKVIAALKKAYAQEEDPNMPPKCEEITLTLEPFFSTSAYNYDIMKTVTESASYWRKFIPKDGIKLSEL